MWSELVDLELDASPRAAELLALITGQVSTAESVYRACTARAPCFLLHRGCTVQLVKHGVFSALEVREVIKCVPPARADKIAALITDASSR